MYLDCYIFVGLVQVIRAHIELASISDVSSDDTSENDQPLRRINSNKKWQKEGLEIEVPSQRFGSDGMEIDNNEVIWTTAVNPPLDPRFRRAYNPDEVASVREYPFMAAVLVNKELWCGGVIIDTDAVLTAAHCLQLQYTNRFIREYVKMISVRVGSDNATAGGELLHVTEIFFHPNYKPQTLEFNFAVVKLHKSLNFGGNGNVDMVPYSKENRLPVYKKITFLGWGSVLSDDGKDGAVLLQKVELPIYDLADCQEIYGRNLVTKNNFCAGYITVPMNICNHDAGGPAVIDGTLVGVLTFSSERCDRSDQPAVFSNVGAIASWLEKLEEKKLKLWYVKYGHNERKIYSVLKLFLEKHLIIFYKNT